MMNNKKQMNRIESQIFELRDEVSQNRKILEAISEKLGAVQKDTEKNAEIASLFTKYKPTIDKVEVGLERMTSWGPRSWLGYNEVDRLEDSINEEPELEELSSSE